MIRGRTVLLSFPILLLLPLLTQNALACTCLAPPTVQDEFERYENVLVAKLTGFEEIARYVEESNVHRIYAGILDVEKVYKGNLREKQTIKIFSGGGGDCSGGFEKSEFGTSFLFYMGGPGKLSKYPASLFGFGICSRSGSLKRVAADLKYLDNRKALAGKSRLSGTIATWGENISLPSVSGLSVYVNGSNFRRELKTDKDGFFEIWDIPAGKHELVFQLPQGWKIQAAQVIPAADRRGWERPSSNSINVVVTAGKHTEVNSFLTINNEISGKVFSPSGSPMKGVCVSAYWLTPTSDSYMIPSDCTDENGEFKISELPPGKYRIDVNSRGNITASNPFKTFYYPGVEDKEKAEPVFIKEGVSVRDLVIRVNKVLPLIRIAGQLIYKGGAPVSDEEVRFYPLDDETYERVEVRTDENGRFSFELPIGAKGEVKATTNIWVIQFEKCAEALALRKTRRGRDADIQSNIASIRGQGSQPSLQLTYPITCR